MLFVDLVDSTALVAGRDPEVARRRVTQFFERASRCIRLHGGTVEKYAGDAVMAAFGVPVAHEDDADRAVRAGLAILETVSELGLEARIGIEAGEVVADDSDSTFATGEAVNVAARLQQAAEAGQILIGPAAHRLTLGRIEVEELGPLDLRGLNGGLWVWRALAARDGRPPPAGEDAPLIGREAELELLHNTLARVIRDRRAHLFTIYGDPGVGKSRLAREFVASLDDVTIFSGRCLPYGEGVTYWPVAEMVKASAGIADDEPTEEAFEKLAATCEIEAVADLLGLASGILASVEGERSQEELAWAARAWAQRFAEVQPLVLVFEDIHWAEDPLFDLIEHLAAWVRDAPLLILCLARPELLDARPAWGGGRLRATAIELGPLPPEESEELADALFDKVQVDDACRDDVLAVAEGNPLFLEETVRMLSEGGAPGDRIPDTLQALIAARIDRLPTDAKAVLQRASVLGRIFYRGALEHALHELDGEVEPLLQDLLLREFVVDEPRSTISGERAFRFKHVLIREVAYGGLSKEERARHHERFAGWLKERAGEELLEIRAYHLERACSLHLELEGAVPPDLATEAGAALEKAARRALSREAYETGRRLALQAIELDPTLQRRYLAAYFAWRLGDLPTVAREMGEVRGLAEEAGDARIEGIALTALGDVALYQRADVPEGQRLLDRALQVLRDDTDAGAYFEALTTRASVASWRGDPDEVLRYLQEAFTVALVSGRKDLQTLAALGLARRHLTRLELDEAKPLIEQALVLAEESASVRGRAGALSARALLHRLRGDVPTAETEYDEALRLYTEIGSATGRAQVLKSLGRLAMQTGDEGVAEKRLRESIKILRGVDERGTLCESQRSLAQLLVRLGRIDEAERLAIAAMEIVSPEDVHSRMSTTMTLGVVRAAQGRDDEAEQLLRRALEIARESGYYEAELEPLEELAAFLRARGRDGEADEFDERRAELCPSAPKSAVRIA